MSKRLVSSGLKKLKKFHDKKVERFRKGIDSIKFSFWLICPCPLCFQTIRKQYQNQTLMNPYSIKATGQAGSNRMKIRRTTVSSYGSYGKTRSKIPCNTKLQGLEGFITNVCQELWASKLILNDNSWQHAMLWACCNHKVVSPPSSTSLSETNLLIINFLLTHPGPSKKYVILQPWSSMTHTGQQHHHLFYFQGPPGDSRMLGLPRARSLNCSKCGKACRGCTTFWKLFLMALDLKRMSIEGTKVYCTTCCL